MIEPGFLRDCRPVADRILLLRLPDLPSNSALVIPDVASKPSRRGKVERLGNGRWMDGWRRPLSVPLGTIVHYMSCDVDDGKYVLIQEGDILGVESE